MPKFDTLIFENLQTLKFLKPQIENMKFHLLLTFIFFSIFHIFFVIPVSGFSHHKRPVIYAGAEMPKHSQKVWTRPDFKHYLPQDFYYNNVIRHSEKQKKIKSGKKEHVHEKVVKGKNKVADKFRWIPGLLNRIKLSFD